ELAVEGGGAGGAGGAVLGDLPVVDVARELGRVLVLLVLGLEGADADPVLLGEDEAADPNVLEDLRPVALGAVEVLAEDDAARRAELALDRERVARADRA